MAVLSSILPASASKRLRSLAENIAFRVQPEYQGDTLPPIFHYWSARYVYPVLRELGVTSPEDFYLQQIRHALDERGPDRADELRIVSYGSGAGGLELSIAKRLTSAGALFHITCVDFNSTLLSSARVNAAKTGLSDCFSFLEADCNEIDDPPDADVIIVNQFFHHVENLEAFVRALSTSLCPQGRLLSSDVVGRNGHVPWGGAQKVIESHWEQLPRDKRYDRYFGRTGDSYQPVDHSAYSNEGIRAQDVVSVLLDHFDFEIFVTFGGAIMPFVERRIGFNFDPEQQVDRDFIDRVQREDESAIRAGMYPASNMIAALRHRGLVQERHYRPVTPMEHVAVTRAQLVESR